MATGLDVTAVELDEKFCRLIEDRCQGPGRVAVVQADMLTFTAPEPFDAAVFFESFHHCADHLAMLRRLHDIVRPGGAVLFAAEPVQRMDYPWGPRLDGLSVWSSRTHGWLELGFDVGYFDRALSRTGWTGRRVAPRCAHGRARRDRGPGGDAFMTRVPSSAAGPAARRRRTRCSVPRRFPTRTGPSDPRWETWTLHWRPIAGRGRPAGWRRP